MTSIATDRKDVINTHRQIENGIHFVGNPQSRYGIEKKVTHKSAKRHKSKSPLRDKNFVKTDVTHHTPAINQNKGIDKPLTQLQRTKTSTSIIVRSQSKGDTKTPFTARSYCKKYDADKLMLDIQAASNVNDHEHSGSCPQLNLDKHCSLTTRDVTCKLSESKEHVASLPNSGPTSPASTPGIRRRAWSNDPNYMLKAALLKSDNSTPKIRKKRIDLGFTPKFLSSPSSRQSSSHSFKTADIKVIVYNTAENTPRKQNITENLISKNEKVIEIVDTSVVSNGEKEEVVGGNVLPDEQIESVTQIQSNPTKRTKDNSLTTKVVNRFDESVTQIQANPTKRTNDSSLTTRAVNRFDKQVTDNTLPNILAKGDEYLAEGLTEDVYNKCKRWLEGLKAFQDDKCLEVVTLPPIEWND